MNAAMIDLYAGGWWTPAIAMIPGSYTKFLNAHDI